MFWLVMCASLLPAISTHGSDCDQLTGDQKSECESLEAQRQRYETLLKTNQKQQTTLKSTLTLLELEDKKLEREIANKVEQIASLEAQVKRIAAQIEENDRTLKNQQAMLRDLIRSYYESKRDQQYMSFINTASLMSSISETDRVSQTEDKLAEMASNLYTLEKNLTEERNALLMKQNALEESHSQLEEKNSALDSNKESKQVLMEKTKGEEAKYQQMLAKIEQQKQELLNIDELSTASGLTADDYEKPTEGLASTSWYYSQKDSRWGNDNIGQSRSKMKDWGCAVASVAMTFKYHGSSVTPKSLADNNKYFYWDLIVWPKSWSNPSISLVSSYTHGNINWNTVDSEIKKGNPVIVYIKKTNGGGGHYVVVHHKVGSKYVVHDPYFGSNIYLDTSRALVGRLGSDSGTKIDQMIIYHKN